MPRIFVIEDDEQIVGLVNRLAQRGTLSAEAKLYTRGDKPEIPEGTEVVICDGLEGDWAKIHEEVKQTVPRFILYSSDTTALSQGNEKKLEVVEKDPAKYLGFIEKISEEYKEH